MEEDFRKLLECNRSKFRAAVAVERLLCPLTVSHVISAEELQALQNESPAKRLDKLLDIVKRRDYGSFKKFCVVLETTYPYMLNCMFLGVEPPASATARIEKANQNKVVEKEFEVNHSRMSQCANRRNNIARSTSMTGHDLWKDRYSLLKNELKAVKRDLEQVKSELQRVEKERDSACHQLAELSGKQTVENIELQKNTCTSNSNSITNEKNNDYERLKREYVNVLTELQILRQQKADFSEKHNAALQEAEYFRKQHKTVLNKCDLLVREAQGLNRKLEESSRECEKIKQDYEEIVLLREREKFEMKDGNIDLMLDRHQNPEDTFATEKYECLQKDYDQLQETHRELRSEYNHVFNRLQSTENDYSSMKDQFDRLISERDSLVKDSSGLKQQCEAALKNVEKAIRDRDNAVKSTQQAQAEKDAALKDLDKAMSQKVKIARELNKVTEERNAVVNEYRLVMSERDNVHRETEKVQDHFHLLQTANKYLTEEKEKLNNLNSALQDEINHYLAENDKLLGEIYSLKDKNQSLMLEIKNIVMEREKAIDDCDMLKHERDAARKERSEAIIHRDKILKECFKVKQKQELITKGEGKEMDSLRKQFQILSKELTNALHEADIAKQRCDWALLERDKAIHEHERLQNSHEHLQDEYSRVRNEMMDMLHDSDHIRTQHSEIIMELIDLKNRIESHLTSKGSERELLSSRDSAIDTDSMEWETESIVLEKVSRDKDLGIIIGGGRDTPLMPNDSSIVVTDVTKGSIAEGKLKVNDCLLKVNDLDLTNVEHKTAVQAITESSVINLTVRRRRSSSVKSLVHPVRLTLTEGNEHGIHVDEAKFIRYISPGSVASNHPMLSVGDKILTINGVSVENLSQDETDKLLSTSTVSLAVQKAKSTTPTHALHSLLEEVNNKINYENDMYQNLQSHRKKMLLMDSCNEVYEQGHRRGICYSGRSSPTTEGTSFQDSVSEPALNASPSLTPLYDGGKEKSQGTQTDSSEASIDANSDTHLALHDAHSSSPQVSPETSRSFMTDSSDHPFQCRNTSNEKPLPPPRSFSYMTTLMSSSTMPMSINGRDSKHYGTERSLPSPPMITSTAGHYTPSMTDEYPLDQTRTNASHRSRGTRPQSAPSSRNQYLPYTSHLDPLALAAPKLSPPAPPASAAVLKSRTVPFYTATSYVIPRYNAAPAKTQQCMPLSSRRDITTPSNSGSVSKSHGGLSLDQCLPIQHARQGSSHSVDENDFRRKQGSQQSFDSSSDQQSNKLMNRMSLPGVRFSSQPCFPSGVSGSSVGSAGSLSSGQGTPLRTPTTPIVPVMEGEILAFDFSGHAPLSSADVNRNPEPRLVHIEKKDTLGISIAPGNNGGIFVCSVSAGSVAEKAGLKYGDQLLEYNGVNLRCANYEQAAKILKESGNSVTILAQFNPQRALEGDFDIGTCNSSISESSTACSTPVNRRKVKRDDSTITPPLPKDEKVVPQSDIEIPGDVRYVYLNHTSTNLGFNIAGGNATGIFVSEVDANGDVAKELSVGDQILEYDGCDMLSCTAEQALLELCKPTPGAVQALVQYNPAKFSAIKDQPGDSFYVRCLYDHTPNSKEELGFKKGDILYITDTMYQGYIGCWKACLVSPEDAQKRENGIVPSRMKAEQEILLHRSLALAHGDDHKLSGRRSLFRRSKKSSHSLAISHSREGSDSAASISTLSSDLGVVSYQTVEKLDSHIPRVVILFGPLAEVLCEKLADDFPYKFVYCKSEFVSLSDEKIDKSIAEGTFIDYSWKGGQLACTTLTSIKKVTDKHPLVVVSPQAIERLNTLQVYPIVLYIRFKSYKQIKEMRDSKYIPEKITSKDAKEMFENAQRLEKDYKHLFNGIVHGHSIGSICTAIQEAAAEQQKKTIWVPLSSV